MKKSLGECLIALGVRYQQQEDVFFTFRGTSSVPSGTFLVVPDDSRITYFSAFPFEVTAARLPDTLIAMNALNDLIPFGRFYFDVNSTDNAVFYDQYLLLTDGAVTEAEVKFVLSNDACVLGAYGALLSDVNDGKLKLGDFVKRIKA